VTLTPDAPPAKPGAEDAPSLVRRSVTALIISAVFAVPFVILTVLVLSESEPLERLDKGVADNLNSFVGASQPLVGMLLTLGSISEPWVLRFIALGIAVLLWRGGDKLAAIWLAVTMTIAGVLGLVLKLLVERARPDFPEPVTTASGFSFPSGHALNSMTFAACMVVLLWPRTKGWLRVLSCALAAFFVALVGLDRIALGVHYVSDVVAGWAIGLAIVAATTLAFGMLRRRTPHLTNPLPDIGGPVIDATHPGSKAGGDTSNEIATGKTAAVSEDATWPRTLGHLAVRLVPGWVVICLIITAIGWLVTDPLKDVWPMTVEDDINTGLESARVSFWNSVTFIMGWLGATAPIVGCAIVAAIVLRTTLHRWAEAVFILAAPLGQSVVFFFTQLLITRDRPEVERLDDSPPTSSFPSGHTSAAMSLWWGLTIVVLRVMKPGWRRNTLAVLFAIIPLCVIFARLYRGMHHPTDIAASLVNATLILILTDRVVRGTTFPEAKEVRSS
jgi:undecaprenyl-diphosphatase